MKNIIITVLVLLTLGVGTYLVYDNVIKKEDVESKKNYSNNESNVDNSDKTNDVNNPDKTNDVNNPDKTNDVDKNESNIELKIEPNPVPNYGTKKYSFKIDEKGNITFDKDGKLYREYKCNSKQCELIGGDIQAGNGKYGFSGDKIVLATCGDECERIDRYGGTQFYGMGEVVLYDVATGTSKVYKNVKKVSYGGAQNLMVLKHSDGERFLSDDGFIDRKIDGELSTTCYEGCVLNGDSIDYEKNLLIIKRNGKYGIETLKDGKTIVENKFSNLKFAKLYYPSYTLSDFFITEVDGNDNLYKISNQSQITKAGYDRIYLLDSNTMLVYKDKYFSFKTLDEKDIISDKLRADSLFSVFPKIPEGVRISASNKIISFTYSVGTDLSNYKLHNYEYNLETKTLKQVN